MSGLVFLPAALCWWALKIIIIIEEHCDELNVSAGLSVCMSHTSIL